uniref:Hyaluronidase n=1 Tax=Meleagris gallopavo TaxID=9103 RepID=A0A803Y3W6_MELGA
MTRLWALGDFGCPPAALSPQAVPQGMGPVLALWAWLVLGSAGGESPVPTALAGGQPFAVLWNIPSGRCQRRFGVGLPLADYGIVENQGGRFAGQNITIFYKNKFGLYPYISPQGVPYNGGIPQRAPLQAHLARVAGDVQLHLRPTFSGLAVVDWEEWRPLWARNWGQKRVYQLASQRWARKRGWGRRLARRAFERAARALMEQTLLLGRSLRPAGLWGFYRFPDCFNGDWAKVANYTGHCRPAEVAALGTAGVVLWGDMSYSQSAESCSSLRHYLVSTLGPYVANVTAAARACSLEQCHGHGRCVRRQPQELSILLHLGVGSWAPFRCHCYQGWAGQDCVQPEPQSPACPAPTHSLYGHHGSQTPDTCPRRSSWGW